MKRVLFLCSRVSVISALAVLAVSCSVHEQTLHYDRPAAFFEEALPVGNGRLGAMVYGDPVHERISLSDITLWSGEPDKGEDHPDIKPLGLDGDKTEVLKAIREALDREDYPTAEEL